MTKPNLVTLTRLFSGVFAAWLLMVSGAGHAFNTSGTTYTVTGCGDQTDLQAAFQTAAENGGTVAFACGGSPLHPTIIPVAAGLSNNNASMPVTIDGGGSVILQGGANIGGAVLTFNDMPGTVRNITITGNANGGIIAAGGSLTVINSTISNNVSALGGGIQAEASNGVGNTLTVINSTFYGNIETDGGGGDIANLNNDNGPVAAPPVLIQNSILLDGCDNLFQGTYTDGGGNIDGGAIGAGRFGAGTNCIADTAHGSLFTVSAASVIGSALEGGLYFPLANGSPAIGLGTNCPTRDELGNPRNAASCTAGAIELNTPPHSVPALTPAAVALSALLLGAIGWGAVRRA